MRVLLLLFAGCLCFQCINAAGNSWVLQVSKDVTGEIGKTVSLPCLFSYHHHLHKSHDSGLTVIWRIKHPYNGTVVFKCVSDSSGDPCKTTINYKNKFRLIGNLHNNNISISIDNLTWEDSNRYYCRVELSSDRHDKYETKSGTLLHISAPPRIVNISVAFDKSRGYHAVCTAEGEPIPTLVWTDPMNTHEVPLLTSPILKHQRTSELHHLRNDGKYTCVATNSHGRVEGSVYFFKYTAEGSGRISYIILCAALGAKLLLMFLMFGAVSYYSRDSTRSITTPSRNTQESTYENYNQRSQ
ncbi:sialic acid-binding Ig-like lectin 15 [Leptodactylus fuscus]|uniref:sialic acid-binding Ig-like lectin 15 n=1 Tax=Leptodactylus fuscus TaxID=238119 RepID=UPI003F4F2E78